MRETHPTLAACSRMPNLNDREITKTISQVCRVQRLVITLHHVIHEASDAAEAVCYSLAATPPSRELKTPANAGMETRLTPNYAPCAGPVTILNWSFPRKDVARSVQGFQLALALRDEVADLEAAGCKIIQVLHPAHQTQRVRVYPR